MGSDDIIAKAQAEKEERRRWTQRMTLHLNGDTTQMHRDLYRDGGPTGIRRATVTAGRRSGYRKTVDKLICGEEEFDLLATKGEGALDWLKAHAPKDPRHDH